MNADDPRHGTYAGYNAHRKSGIPMCGPCRKAGTDYVRDYRATRGVVKSQKEAARNRARHRAAWRLVDLHADEFHRLSVEEMRKESALAPSGGAA